MDILFDAARRVNPARPFAAGLTPPDPDPAGSPVTSPDLSRLDAAADEALGGDIESDPEHWPEWTDYHHFEPTLEDRAEWAAESERLDSQRADREIDTRAAESAATDALSAGLVPADLPPARTRRENPMTDRDVARIGAVG